MSRSILVSFFVLALSSAVFAQWVKQNVKTTASFRGLSVVNEKVVWASGTGGTVIRTIDGGKTWDVMTVPGAEKLDFRDIESFDANTAYILSIGNGESSRIYRTTDGGKTWQLEFKNDNERAFFDAIACFDRENCFAMSDPVDGKFVLIKRSPAVNSRIGIRTPKWLPIDNSALPAKQGEAAFAASGTCLITQGKNNLFLVTGGSDARVFRSNDRGVTWSVSDTPIVKGTAGSGIFSIAMRDDKNGVIVGGNYEKPDEISNNFAITSDGGRTWTLDVGPNGHAPNGYRSSVAFLDKKTLVVAGSNGADIRWEKGKTWNLIAEDSLNSVQSDGKFMVWAVGPKGLVVQKFFGDVTVE